jgi:hypothetical protein
MEIQAGEIRDAVEVILETLKVIGRELGKIRIMCLVIKTSIQEVEDEQADG